MTEAETAAVLAVKMNDDALRPGESPMHVLMVAAENGALPGFKVGGVADVVRDLPVALARLGCEVSVVCPGYGRAATLDGAEPAGSVETQFRGRAETLALWRVPTAHEGVSSYLLDHDALAAGGRVYCDDGEGRPFATDASRFALFCAGVADAVTGGSLPAPQVIHLHDWHAALMLVLRRFEPRHAALRRIRTVYSIHNLAIQGVRPLRGDPSSLEEWFPELAYEPLPVGDPRWPDCINPMAAGIRLADAVATVSPGYAREILEPNAIEAEGRHGGEGLEADLRSVHERGDLVGILNGCEYPDQPSGARPAWRALCAAMEREVLRLAGMQPRLASAHFVASKRLETLPGKRPRPLLITVGRVTDQKLGLLSMPAPGAPTVLDAILDRLGDEGLYVILGSGEPDLEQFLVATAARRPGLLFLRGYAEALADDLYRSGELFMMPSSYEPCGISQMLAMREGQPCLVHAVGGLRDTVSDGTDGFSFGGDSSEAQAAALVRRLDEALTMRADKPKRFAAIAKAAAAKRFSWSGSARAYIDRLYAAP